MRIKQKNKVYVKLAVVLAVSLVLELLISNFAAIGILTSGAEKKEIDMKERFGSEIVTVDDNNPLLVENVDVEMKNVCITLQNDSFYYSWTHVGFTDDNFRFDDAFGYNKAAQYLLSDGNNFLDLSSFGKVGSFKLESDDTIDVKSISFNVPPDFSFSLVGFLAVFTAISCVVFGLWKMLMRDDDYKYLKLLTVFICVLIAAFAGMANLMNGTELLTEISDDVTDEDEYVQLFDAFRKGQLNLDIDYDTSVLDSLENPYDRSERNEKDIHGAIWDRAYYNGKFYAYFGAAPVLTVYYPIYILTGKAATPLLASTVICIIDVIFMSLLYILFLRKFCGKVSLLLALLGQAALLFGSVIFAAAVESAFYYTAVLSVLAWTAAFLYFLFTAYFSESFKKRVLFLALSGVSVVLIAASRPTLLLYCFIGIIPAIAVFADKKESIKNKIVYAASVAVPVVIGAALIMVYNYKRFESPFEFGFNYQLTVSRAQANTIKLSLLPAALYHYFFQQPDLDLNFPYIDLQKRGFYTYSRYIYIGITMGILSYPVSWGMLLAPFALSIKDKKKDIIKNSVVYSLAGAAVLMAFIDMCKAGSHYRYTADIAFFFILAALIVIFNFGELLREKSEKAYNIFCAFAAAAMVLTVIIGWLLMFANEGENMFYDYPAVTVFLGMM